jgi:Dyp-type peroxidase family
LPANIQLRFSSTPEPAYTENPMSDFDLERTISWKDAILANTSEDTAVLAMLSELQGNILKSHGRENTLNIFFQFDPQQEAAARKFIRAFHNEITTALDQFVATQVYKSTEKDGGLFLTVLMSHSGYDHLKRMDAKPDGIAFSAGMRNRRSILADPDSNSWDEHLSLQADAMIILADDDPEVLRGYLARLKAHVLSLNGEVTIIGHEIGLAMRNSDSQHIEHFGYVDGRSQPLVLREEIAEEKAISGFKFWDPTVNLSQALVKCPGGKLDVSHGSYFVFRKLQQDVKGFKLREDALTLQLEKESKLPVGDLAGAYVVGRFENGTPVVEANISVPVGTGPKDVPNDFNYDSDPAGLRCPFAGHIRKTNPRDKNIASSAVLMFRRGITYGAREDDPNDGKTDNKPVAGVGLLFMAYQSSLEKQFEFTQHSWANNTGFHINSPAQPVGIDPVIGQPRSGGLQKYPLEYKVGPLSEPFDFSGFVTMKGGEYFFAPSLSFIKTL